MINTLTRFGEYCSRAIREYGVKFSDAELYPAFVPYFNSRERVKIQFAHGGTDTGTIGVTTGWRPVFLLMRRKSDRGSSLVLGPNDKVIAVRRGKVYRTL